MLAFAVVLALVPQLQPATYTSPSGACTLRVEPLTREGTAGAEYVLSEGASERWRVRHPFALHDAAVTDEGRVGGYAYFGAPPDAPAGGLLRIVVLSPAGEIVLDEAHEREMSRQMHAAGVPLANGMFVQQELGRLVVRIGADDYASGESWWAYDLATGKPLFDEQPKLALGLASSAGAAGVRALAGTPLVLVHWVDNWLDPRSGRVQLLDAERKAAWQLDLPGAAALPQGQAPRDWRDGAVLSSGPRRFELLHAKEDERVSYAVAEGENGGWAVSEVARAPFNPAAAERTFSKLVARPVGEIELRAPAAEPREIRDVLAFGFDADGALRFARREADGYSLVRLEPDGGVRGVTRVVAAIEGRAVSWSPLSDARWIAVASSLPEQRTARAWLVDEATGEGRELAKLAVGHRVDRVAALDAGRIVMLSTWEVPFGLRKALTACDLDGVTHWTVAEDMQDPTKLFSPQDVAVTSDGRVVVLDVIKKSLQVYSDAGAYLATIDLERAWGEEPNYPSSIVPDRDGGVLVHDFHGATALWRMGMDGAVRAKLDASAEDGVPRDEYRRNVRAAPDGRLWTTDGHELVRLGEDGVADLHVGSPQGQGELGASSCGAIDSTFGRALLLDARTRALHVFDERGERVLLGTPRPADLAELRLPLRMACDSSGGAFTGESQYARRHVRFGGDGASLGIVDLRADGVSFVPGRDAYWGGHEEALARFGADAALELSLPKRPDGHWWRRIDDVAVAPDGRVAVLDLPRDHGMRWERGAGVIAVLDAEGRALGQHELPEHADPNQLSFAGHRVLAWTYAGTAWVLDLREWEFRTLELEGDAPKPGSAAFGLSPSGEEVWVLEPKEKRVSRYALPD